MTCPREQIDQQDCLIMTSKPMPTVSGLFLSIAAALCIPAVCAGNVESAKVNCDSPQGWVFAFNKEGAKEPGV